MLAPGDATDGTDQPATFGDLLRRHRRGAALSQDELARRCGLSVDAIAALERGRRRAPRRQTVRLLAEALRLDPAAHAAFVAAAGAEVSPPVVARTVPVPADELVGRKAELDRATQALIDPATRMLTLTGPGGVGKTRLAVATAAAVAAAFEARVGWVPLAGIAEPAGVAPAFAAAVGLRPGVDAGLVDQLAETIGNVRMLLVVDNAEHVVGPVARLCADLLERCPRLRLLTTSRELLRIPGEVVQVVPALPLPEHEWPPDRLAGSAAVRLFLRRAEARGNAVEGDRLPVVAAVVRRLEGIPLAIELAAARTNVLTVEELAAELDGSFEVLADDSPVTPDRQRTMGGAIGWSHELLDDVDRDAFAALSVFVGGWTLAATVAVLPGPVDRPAALALMSRLVDKSLVRMDRGPDGARYEMLAVIREFARERLAASGRYDEVARRHAAYLADLVGNADGALRGPEQLRWLNRLARELDNLRAAVGWATEAGAAELAVRLAGEAWTFCYLRGHYAEGRDWLERALRLDTGTSPPRARAKALLGAGTLAFLQCDYAVAESRLDAALALYTEVGDDSGRALTLQRLGGIARERAEYDAAVRLHHDSLALYTALGDPSGTAWAHNHLGFVAWLRGDLETCRAECTVARRSFDRIGDTEGIAWSLISLGVAAQYAGDLAGSEALLRDSLEVSQRAGFREGVAWSLNQLGVVERRRGRTERAVHLLDESLAEHRDLGDRWRTGSVLEELAAVAQLRGRSAYAAFLLGAAAAIREQIGAPVPACERDDQAATLDAVRAALNEDALKLATDAGRAAPLHAVADGYPAPSPARRRSSIDPRR